MVSIYKRSKELQEEIKIKRSSRNSIGFVPTMGALHQGHLSLIQQSSRENNFTTCSIFVNPTQFNDPRDFQLYPRDTDRDIAMLKSTPCDHVYIPDVEDVYPHGKAQDAGFDPGELARKLEGASRPGHFKGVITVVKRLLEIVMPDRAYFGQKDYQQYLIIKKMAAYYNMAVEVVMCPIVREEHGLAMSSRNERLAPVERKEAAAIYEALNEAAGLVRENKMSFENIKARMTDKLNAKRNFTVDYFDICSADDLESLRKKEAGEKVIICTAVMVSGVRLIDNLLLD